MNSISQKILDDARNLPEGEILSPRRFLHLGERAEIDRIMSQLVEQKKLFQIWPEMFVLSYQTRFGICGPSINKIAAGVARITGERIAISGADAANLLGLSKHVPMRDVFWTSGQDRIMYLGPLEFKLKHVEDWQLYAPNTKTGDAIRALSYLGKLITDQVFDKLKSRLDEIDRLDEKEQDEILELRPNMPTWMAENLNALAAPAPVFGNIRHDLS